MAGTRDISLLDHFRKLWFFNFNRFENDNYRLMREYFARITIAEIEEFLPLWSKQVLDVGGARGEYCKVFHDLRDCDAINIDPDPNECAWPGTIVAYAHEMPFRDAQFDLVICRSVLEHIPQRLQLQSMREMCRLTRLSGICYVVIPPWYNPHAGHNLKPFHVLPFRMAKFLRQLLFRTRIDGKSYAEALLYPITFSAMLKLISSSGFKVLATKNTLLRLHALTKIPLLREVLVPSVAFILKPAS